MQNSKHIYNTNLKSEEYLREQIKNHQGDWRIFLQAIAKGILDPLQTVLYDHYQGDISEPKFTFSK